MCVCVCVWARARFSSFLKQITRYAIENRIISLDLNVESFENTHTHARMLNVMNLLFHILFTYTFLFPCCCCFHKIFKRRDEKSLFHLRTWEDGLREWKKREASKTHSIPIQVDDKRILSARKPFCNVASNFFSPFHFVLVVLTECQNCAQEILVTVHVLACRIIVVDLPVSWNFNLFDWFYFSSASSICSFICNLLA